MGGGDGKVHPLCFSKRINEYYGNVGFCCNSDIIQSLDLLHCRAARLIYNLPKDMASAEVLERVQWSTLFSIIHVNLLFLFA